MRSAHAMPFGAQVGADGVRFAVWAPAAHAAAVHVDDRIVTMHPAVDGFFSVTDPSARAGSRYRFRFDTSDLLVPDPASRFNPDDVHAASEVVAPGDYTWHDASWRGGAWPGAVIYELHVGTFTAAGTYAAAAERLDELVALGVTALELMPLAATPGRFNWGYDGVLPFAPHARYGRPDDLKRFVDAAHARGLMVLLDVVYNHFGPDGNYLGLYAPTFFTPRHKTPWGNAINFDDTGSAAVRSFFVHNALYWLEEYHFDGLRLDAVHTIVDDSDPNFLHELATAVRALALGRTVHLVLENDRNDAALLQRDDRGDATLYTAQWNDDFHHALYVLLTGERRGHYEDYADARAQLLRALLQGFAFQGEYSPNRRASRGCATSGLPLDAFVNFLQNHDQIGNRPDAARLCNVVGGAELAAAETLLALLPTPIMVFMGDELAAPNRFPFFCDFSGELGAAVTQGRRSEFGSLWHEVDDAGVPSPIDPAAPAAAVLDIQALAQDGRHAATLALWRHRLALRRRELVPRLPALALEGTPVDQTGLTARWRLGDGSTLQVDANLGSAPLEHAAASSGRELLSTHERNHGAWPPWFVRWSIHPR